VAPQPSSVRVWLPTIGFDYKLQLSNTRSEPPNTTKRRRKFSVQQVKKGKHSTSRNVSLWNFPCKNFVLVSIKTSNSQTTAPNCHTERNDWFLFHFVFLFPPKLSCALALPPNKSHLIFLRNMYFSKIKWSLTSFFSTPSSYIYAWTWMYHAQIYTHIDMQRYMYTHRHGKYHIFLHINLQNITCSSVYHTAAQSEIDMHNMTEWHARHDSILSRYMDTHRYGSYHVFLHIDMHNITHSTWLNDMRDMTQSFFPVTARRGQKKHGKIGRVYKCNLNSQRSVLDSVVSSVDEWVPPLRPMIKLGIPHQKKKGRRNQTNHGATAIRHLKSKRLRRVTWLHDMYDGTQSLLRCATGERTLGK